MNGKPGQSGPTETRRDGWGKFEILSKGLAAILVTGGLTWYGIHSSHQQTTLSEKNRKAQVFVETMNHRETAMSDMKSKMFDTLMRSYFRDESFFGKGKEVESRVAILETIGLNFHDVLHLKPLFTGLDAEIKELMAAEDPGSDRYRELDEQDSTLRKAANRIKTAEILKIRDASGSAITLEVEARSSNPLLDHGLPINIYVREVMPDGVRLQILDPQEQVPETEDGAFTVGFFDMPLQDNSRLGELTYSVILDKTEPDRESAKIKVVILPRSYTFRNSLLFDEMLVDYMEEKQISP